jgi:hypothetical protein
MTTPSGVNTATLEVALANAEREYEEIRFWLDSKRSPFLEDAEAVDQKFSDIRGRAEERLIEMRLRLRDGETEEAWTCYAHFRNLVMPTLANELLAVIGGRYLMTMGYDNIRTRLPQQPHDPKSAVSFSMVARRLVSDLTRRSSRLPGSILIVGEERLGAAEAAIIRLRFPACDLWNLPFTAHEYGYLVGQIDPPPAFRTLKGKVEEKIDPRRHPGAERPVDAACFLPAVQTLWDAYYEAGYVEISDLTSLVGSQLSHLCRLFADAFATYFVGPAYIHALLNLRFIPDKTLYEPVGNRPAFVQRLVFALETLRWMNEDEALYARADASSDTQPFAAELDSTTGLFKNWRQALDTAKQDDRYDEFLGNLKPWLEDVTKALKEPAWRADHSGPKTFKSWRYAQRNQPRIITNVGGIEDTEDGWAVLNAAWSARAAKGEAIRDIIEQNALRQLDLRRPPPSEAGGEQEKAGYDASREKAQIEADIETVRAALRPIGAVYAEFLEMKKNGRFTESLSIIKALTEKDEDEPAYQAYLRLTKN